MNVLLIEDNETLADTIKEYLKIKHIECKEKFDGYQGYEEALTGVYDVIILDVMLPHKNGFEILSELRKNHINTPVLMLTAKSQIYDKIKGFENGADDYLTKPFNFEELLFRLRALDRRKEKIIISKYEFNDIDVNENTLNLICNDDSIKLSQKEFDMLRMLILAKGNTVSKEKITDTVWSDNYDNQYNSTEVYISFLRKKLKQLHSKTKITSIRGIGYKLDEEKE
ncbi:MAG: response regulator transcription factor [Bacilli bacterium]